MDFEGSETILLVEDDESLLRVLSVILHNSGYEVLTARDGEEGLAAAQSALQEIDLLVSDMEMPKISGLTLLEKIRGTRPELPVIFISGYTAEVLAGKNLPVRATFFLKKPFSLDEILEMIRGILDRP
jgi:DNA-binding NtrC family response regulator